MNIPVDILVPESAGEDIFQGYFIVIFPLIVQKIIQMTAFVKKRLSQNA